jgi:pimeloyl-ACP methyl ester carboxylesterase
VKTTAARICSRASRPAFPDDLAAAWSAGQAFLAALLPDARQVIATEAGHYIQVEQPQLVTEAIHQVVDEVRNDAETGRPGTW